MEIQNWNEKNPLLTMFSRYNDGMLRVQWVFQCGRAYNERRWRSRSSNIVLVAPFLYFIGHVKYDAAQNIALPFSRCQVKGGFSKYLCQNEGQRKYSSPRITNAMIVVVPIGMGIRATRVAVLTKWLCPGTQCTRTT